MNPYPTKQGFTRRLNLVSRIIREAGRTTGWPADGYRPRYDECFDQGDADALIYGLVERVYRGDTDLEAGIIAMGMALWSDWQDIHAQGQQLLDETPDDNFDLREVCTPPYRPGGFTP